MKLETFKHSNKNGPLERFKELFGGDIVGNSVIVDNNNAKGKIEMITTTMHCLFLEILLFIMSISLNYFTAKNMIIP